MGRKLPSIARNKSRARHFTPPPDLVHMGNQKYPRTPSRCGVLWAKIFSQRLGINIPAKEVEGATGVSTRSQSRILASKSARTIYHVEDKGLDPRGRKKALKRTDTAAIADYLDAPTTSLDAKGALWLDIAIQASVELPQITNKRGGKQIVSTKTIQHSCKLDEDLINAVYEEERELTDAQARARLDWIDI